MSDRAGTSNDTSATIISGHIVQGRDITMALPSPAKPAVGGLPAQLVFVGRDQELNELAHVLKPASPMFAGPASATVTGLGGVGKTALAVQAAHHAVKSGWFPGGAIFVDLRGYDKPERRPDTTDTLETLLQAIGVMREQIPNGLAARELLWRSALSERASANLSTLILLDNASSSKQIQPLIVGGDTHRFLITSRHNLGTQGVQIFNLDVLSHSESLDQLGQELAAAYPDDERCSIESSQAAELVELCDRLPLAVHIAAALLTITPDRTLSELVDAMRDERYRLSELTFDDDIAVRATFDLSYASLDSDQAHLFRMMALNPGVDVGIEAIAALSDFDVAKARRVITQLARAHLVFARGFQRWRMHDLVRIHASEHASCDPEYTEAIGRMLSYYLNSAKNATARLRSIDNNSTCPSNSFDTYKSALAWLDTECQSVTSSVTLALACGRYDYVLDLPAMMCDFFHMRQRWSDWITTHRAALTASLELGDPHREARTRNNLGIANRETGLHSEAIEQHREAVRIFHNLRDFRNLVGAQGNIGLAYLELGEHQAAAEQIELTLQFADLHHDARDKARSLVNLGLAYKNLGRSDEAVEAILSSIPLFRECGDRRAEAMAHANLAITYRTLGRLQSVDEACCQAIELAKALGDSHLRAHVLNIQGQTRMTTTDFEGARLCHLEALTLAHPIGDLQNEGDALFGLAACSANEQNWQESADYYRKCLHVEKKLGGREAEACVLSNLGTACFELDLFDEAVQHWKRALDIFSSINSESAANQASDLRTTLQSMEENQMPRTE